MFHSLLSGFSGPLGGLHVGVVKPSNPDTIAAVQMRSSSASVMCSWGNYRDGGRGPAWTCCQMSRLIRARSCRALSPAFISSMVAASKAVTLPVSVSPSVGGHGMAAAAAGEEPVGVLVRGGGQVQALVEV